METKIDCSTGKVIIPQLPKYRRKLPSEKVKVRFHLFSTSSLLFSLCCILLIFNDFQFWFTQARCTICEVTFVRMGNKNIHDQTYHDKIIKRYSCKYCGLVSPTTNIILQHHKKIHSSIPLPKVDEIRFVNIANTRQSE